MSSGTTYEEWISVHESSTDYEGDLVRDRLDEGGVPAVVLTQRDHAFNVNVGDLSAVHVMVPPDYVEKARSILDEVAFTDEELEEAAMNADVSSPDAHDRDREAALDSGIDTMPMAGPSEEDPDDEEWGDEDEEASA